MPVHPLLSLARTLGNPVIDGSTAAVLWQGRTPPRMLDDLTEWDEARPFERLSPSLWAATLTLPLNAYVEYALFDPAGGNPLSDPLNPRRTQNGMGGWNHFFYMPKGKPAPQRQRQPDVARGKLTRHRLPAYPYLAGKERILTLYEPAAQDPVPLLLVYDGTDYLRRARLDVIADNLIAHGHVRPFAIAFLPNGGRNRMLEYACSDITLGFLLESVLPLARQRLNLLPPAPGACTVLGASMGGLMALYTGLRMPQVFGGVISQSGAFRISGFDMLTSLLVETLPPQPLRIWMDAGRFESLLECNRTMHALLLRKEYAVEFRQYSGGHNYTAWANELPRALEALFQPE